MIDLHCHILHGLDDGAQFLEDSLEMARLAAKDGITKIVATPHLYRNNYGTKNLESIEQKKTELVRLLKRNDVNVEIFSGAEVHITENLLEEVGYHRQNLVINRGSYMLVEFPSNHIYAQVKELFFELMSEQIVPIIAHPERNYVFMERPDLLYELILMGAYTQANGGSFRGLYGNKIQNTAFRFLKWNYFHFVGSDGHNTLSFSPLLSHARDAVFKFSGEKIAESLFMNNPHAVLEDRELPYCPEPINPRDTQKSFRYKVPHFLRKMYKK